MDAFTFTSELKTSDLPALRALHTASYPFPWSASFFDEVAGADHAVCLVFDAHELVGAIAIRLTKLGYSKDTGWGEWTSSKTGKRFYYHRHTRERTDDRPAAFVPEEELKDEKRYQAYVRSLVVHPTYRRRGLGRHLVDLMCERMAREKNCTVVYLHVMSNNAEAIPFYRAMGFEEAERLEKLYHFPDKNATYDGLLMRKTLCMPVL